MYGKLLDLVFSGFEKETPPPQKGLYTSYWLIFGQQKATEATRFNHDTYQ